jgi:hypothetical protein
MLTHHRLNNIQASWVDTFVGFKLHLTNNHPLRACLGNGGFKWMEED